MAVAALPVVATLTVKGTGAAPETFNEFGETEQVDIEGAPVHVSATVPVNPSAGVSCRGYCAVWPAVTVSDVPVVELELGAN